MDSTSLAEIASDTFRRSNALRLFLLCLFRIGLVSYLVSSLLFTVDWLRPELDMGVEGSLAAGALFMFGIALRATVEGIEHLLSRRSQRRRDERAAIIMDQLQSGESPIYSLYLRAFVTTGRLHTETGMRSPMASEIIMGSPDTLRRLFAATPIPTTDFETLLAEAVEADKPLVALGKPREFVGAGRIDADEDTWRTDLELLVNGAATVFIVASFREGTRWEANLLKSKRLFDKTVFVMPPNLQGQLQQDWETTRTTLLRDGICLPRYVNRGTMFKVRAVDGCVSWSRDIKIDDNVDRAEFRKEIRYVSSLEP